MLRITALLRLLALGCTGLLLPIHAQAISYLVSVDTLVLSGTSGYFDLQFNPSGGAPAATATISNVTGNFVAGATTLDGGATGSLPAGVVIENSGALNAVLQAVTFGSSLGFRLDVDVAPGSDLFGTSFGLGVYDDALFPVAGAAPSGFFLIIDFFATSAPSIASVANGVTVELIGAVPEPATYALMLAGLLLLYAAARRRGA